jgi:ribosomal protein L40E
MPRAAEYWRPADPATARIAGPILTEGLCRECGAEFSAGARFCHVCGSKRSRLPIVPSRPMSFADFFDVSVLRQRCGLSAGCLAFFIMGIICLVVAASIGILYKPESLVQWQGLQFWRVEWLLGAAAMMLAGILLKQ